MNVFIFLSNCNPFYLSKLYCLVLQYVHTETQTRYQSRLVKHNKGDNTLDNDQNEYNLLKKN